MLNLLVFYVVLFFSQSKDEAEDPEAPQNVMTKKQQAEFYSTWTMCVALAGGARVRVCARGGGGGRRLPRAAPRTCRVTALTHHPFPPPSLTHTHSLRSYDPLCTGSIRPHELDLFFGSLPRPLGFRPDPMLMNQSLISELVSASTNHDEKAKDELSAASSNLQSLEERYCLIPHDEIHRRVMAMDWPKREGRKQPMREATDGSGLRVSIEDVNIVISKLALAQVAEEIAALEALKEKRLV